jgi:hypothetical protein
MPDARLPYCGQVWQAGFRVTFLSLILLIGWEVINETITVSVGESDMIIKTIKDYGSYVQSKSLVNLEPLNREPVNRY